MTDADLVELREAVARQHRLPDGAAGFIQGRTIEELDASANDLARLIEERAEDEPAADATEDLFSPAARSPARPRSRRSSPGRRAPRGMSVVASR